MTDESIVQIKPLFVPLVLLQRFLPYHLVIVIVYGAVALLAYSSAPRPSDPMFTPGFFPFYLSWVTVLFAAPVVYLKIREKMFKNMLLSVYDRSIMYESGINKREMLIDESLTITVKRSWLQKRYGIGTLVFTATGEKRLTVHDIPEPDHCKKQLEEIFHG